MGFLALIIIYNVKDKFLGCRKPGIACSAPLLYAPRGLGTHTHTHTRARARRHAESRGEIKRKPVILLIALYSYMYCSHSVRRQLLFIDLINMVHLSYKALNCSVVLKRKKNLYFSSDYWKRKTGPTDITADGLLNFEREREQKQKKDTKRKSRMHFQTFFSEFVHPHSLVHV